MDAPRESNDRAVELLGIARLLREAERIGDDLLYQFAPRAVRSSTERRDENEVEWNPERRRDDPEHARLSVVAARDARDRFRLYLCPLREVRLSDLLLDEPVLDRLAPRT